MSRSTGRQVDNIEVARIGGGWTGRQIDNIEVARIGGGWTG